MTLYRAQAKLVSYKMKGALITIPAIDESVHFVDYGIIPEGTKPGERFFVRTSLLPGEDFWVEPCEDQ